MIENRYSILHTIALHEPWRRMQIKPLDEKLCGGEIDWEPGAGWWCCTYCGFIGSAVWQGHYPAIPPQQQQYHPQQYLQEASRVVLIGALTSLAAFLLATLSR